MTPRAIFFDMDDTLLDTSGGVEIAWQATSEVFGPELGHEPAALQEAIRTQMREFWKDEAAVEHWRLRLHDARRHNVEIALLANGLDGTFAQRIADHYWDQQMTRMKLFDDAIETLAAPGGRGFRLALLTNGPAEMQRAKLDRFPLERFFEVVVIEGEFGHGKPDVRVFQHAMDTLGVRPEEAWHVGDNLYADIGGAKRAGIHATWIHRDRLELEDSPVHVPDRVIGHLAELRVALEL